MLWFRGVSKYLEDLVARIDAPLLDNLDITYFHQLIFDTPHLKQFISRAPKFEPHDEAHVSFSDWGAGVTLSRGLKLGVSCIKSNWQLSFLAQVCGSSFPRALIPTVERLYIQDDGHSLPGWQNDIESSQWLELLHPFTAVESLHISSKFTPSIAPALQELVRERMTEVLPALQTLFLEETIPSGPIQEAIDQFVTARRLAVTFPAGKEEW